MAAVHKSSLAFGFMVITNETLAKNTWHMVKKQIINMCKYYTWNTVC